MRSIFVKLVIPNSSDYNHRVCASHIDHIKTLLTQVYEPFSIEPSLDILNTRSNTPLLPLGYVNGNSILIQNYCLKNKIWFIYYIRKVPNRPVGPGNPDYHLMIIFEEYTYFNFMSHYANHPNISVLFHTEDTALNTIPIGDQTTIGEL